MMLKTFSEKAQEIKTTQIGQITATGDTYIAHNEYWTPLTLLMKDGQERIIHAHDMPPELQETDNYAIGDKVAWIDESNFLSDQGLVAGVMHVESDNVVAAHLASAQNSFSDMMNRMSLGVRPDECGFIYKSLFKLSNPEKYERWINPETALWNPENANS